MEGRWCMQGLHGSLNQQTTLLVFEFYFLKSCTSTAASGTQRDASQWWLLCTFWSQERRCQSQANADVTVKQRVECTSEDKLVHDTEDRWSSSLIAAKSVASLLFTKSHSTSNNTDFHARRNGQQRKWTLLFPYSRTPRFRGLFDVSSVLLIVEEEWSIFSDSGRNLRGMTNQSMVGLALRWFSPGWYRNQPIDNGFSAFMGTAVRFMENILKMLDTKFV